MAARPTIKGIFVNSHVKQLRKAKGDRAVAELEKRFGASVHFKNSDNVLVSDEVKIIEICLDLISGIEMRDDARAYEAGRLHFRNFTTTPLAKIIFSMFKTNFKTMMLNSDKIAGHVFRGVRFSSKELGPNSVLITMRNNDYPLGHFRGLFAEWLSFSGLTGEVLSEQMEDGTYKYTINWN